MRDRDGDVRATGRPAASLTAPQLGVARQLGSGLQAPGELIVQPQVGIDSAQAAAKAPDGASATNNIVPKRADCHP